jgi:[methyl-Co(III) methanol-specific corrinoid protein]:coenzyme M methyltransferase
MIRDTSPKRRFLRAFFGGKPGRMPVGNVVSIATLELQHTAATFFPYAHTKASEMATLASAGHWHLHYDTVAPVFSVVQEVAALGAEVDWGGPTMMPSARAHPFSGTDRFAFPARWIEAQPITVVLEAIRILRRHLGDRVVIVGKVMGPWSLSYHMMGTEEFLISTLADPDRARRSLDALKGVTIAFAKAQMQAGADVICLADHATGGMVSPLMYRDMLLPLHKEIIAEAACPMVLHCCGNTDDRIAYFAEAGFDAYHFESQVNLERAVEMCRGRMALIGNINNPSVLLNGTEEDVRAACLRAIDAGVDILAPECAVPLTTPTRNLKILAEAAVA